MVKRENLIICYRVARLFPHLNDRERIQSSRQPITRPATELFKKITQSENVPCKIKRLHRGIVSDAAMCEAIIYGLLKNHIYNNQKKKKDIFLFTNMFNGLNMDNLVTLTTRNPARSLPFSDNPRG